MSVLLTKAEIGTLSSAVGKRISYVGGPYLDHFLSSPIVLLKVGEDCLDFRGEMIDENFEGYVESYSRISVGKASQAEISQTESKGNTYFQASGLEIIDILIERQTISELKNDGPGWNFSADASIHFILTNAVLIISKLSHHDESLHVTFRRSNEELNWPKTETFFEDDLFVTYSTTSEFIQIENGLEGAL